MESFATIQPDRWGQHPIDLILTRKGTLGLPPLFKLGLTAPTPPVDNLRHRPLQATGGHGQQRKRRRQRRDDPPPKPAVTQQGGEGEGNREHPNQKI
jgi:hypothetical protein